MADFELAVAKTIANEGGDKYTETEDDNGGATKYGISLKFLKTLKKLGTTRGNELLYPNSNEETIKNLSQDEAEYIYLNYFWDANRYGEIIDQSIAEKVFDMAVLIGAPKINKLVQTLLCLNNDGFFGDISIKHVNSLISPDGFLGALNFAMMKYFTFFVNTNKTQEKFLLGWLNRAMS